MKSLALRRKISTFAGLNTIVKMTDKKEQTILDLARDKHTHQLLAQVRHNWDVAANRMVQIAKERKEGFYDDNGVEVMSVFCRMERVGSMLLALRNRPQALLLRGFRELLGQMRDDHRMDLELTTLLSPKATEQKIDAPTVWERIRQTYLGLAKGQDGNEAIVRKLFQTHYLPHMDDEQHLSWMKALIEPAQADEPHKDEQQELMESMAYLGANIGKVATNAKTQMALGLLLLHELASLLADACDIRQMADEVVDDIFETAKKELLESDAWKEYWRSHLAHLALMTGSTTLAEELRKDAEEVELQLLAIPGYLYNRWDESAEAFGRALKESDLSDEEMLHLLFCLAKKQALEGEGEAPDYRLQQMRSSVMEQAAKIFELSDERFDKIYERLWNEIVQNPIVGAQLADYRNGKHNRGFNMQCFCHIVGWLNREKHLYGASSPADLGKRLGDRNTWETYKDYIKRTKTVLSAQSISEIESIWAALRP